MFFKQKLHNTNIQTTKIKAVCKTFCLQLFKKIENVGIMMLEKSPK